MSTLGELARIGLYGAAGDTQESLGQRYLDMTMTRVGEQYPGLQPTLNNSAIRYGTPQGPQDDRQMEFYPPWESDNPHPGRNTIEIFNRDLSGNDLRDAVSADLLHGLSAIDPRTGQPADPTFYALRQRLGAARSPQDLEIDRRAYERDRAGPFGAGTSYEDWDNRRRLDAYARAGLFPHMNPEWSGVSTAPHLQPIFEEMRRYLATRPQR